MSAKEEIYTFNEYVLGYDKGNNDRSCLTISKIQNGNMYIMSSLYDGSADVISMMLDNLQQENKKLNMQLDQALKDYDEEMQKNMKAIEVIDKAIEYIETATIDPQSMRHYRGCLLEILRGGGDNE